MSRAVLTETRSQLALQSYLDALLQDATVELAESVSLDEFQAAVLEEQQRDNLRQVETVSELPAESPPATTVVAEIAVPAAVVEPVVELSVAAASAAEPPALDPHQPPQWGEQPFECLLFDVAGLTLAVPLVCLGSIYPLTGQELTPLFGQPDWFLGILPSHAGNLKVLDTARWVMPDRYRDDFREGLQYVISVQGYEWGLAVHQVSRSIRLDPREVKWRTQRNQRPWLAGTVIEHMCALVDVTALAELIASGAVRQLHPASTRKH
ncbi:MULTISPECIES: CheW domain-containing protein [Pseudomonadaceae]|uniref:Chemotaxis protein CheW n=1 Tax=Stutzerimonas degradans TaxID=2968968 RepID=A0A4V1GTT0_9GAMM|nr:MULTISPECIES: CheW domain-containing protein [Pseudomonadaceae]MCQ4233320.1 chemotaxis protein CheW [Stutzerimonas degradans]MCQ4275374.1 chemotaxis protein CheW [Stutzerimonas degradans]NHW03136.1 chemotaxis protein CheW [Stutzerimonas degradans]PNF76341.1 chemotaxis protein CheW [Stutzerimonas degradans]QCT97172.1 chemotaxis protein CheW [Stutzerimonas degradans]